ncbi:MAG: hypothetical protein COY58_07380 [Gammaproteobacteria bacterium CG_4_10_14_0_8_um_filter_38_16]|nr:MAG: hypothetical protein COY58_07380 [Gammaproteobacteria bacterium CG_4_10_14_0_8_um_filter_38_16]PJA02987.1 MAG: hypothetical protein COX72_07605 [Gammaproteobacteria bacterium CG_4_10_14_0_2_um_filter_38_22]PJB09453.1 MAG: hypothetical protein CO120_10060 [Gammaproteobacteria bacterium CG_4_9_14_3_um_filter_38_9]
MKSLNEQLSVYQQQHTNQTNLITHYIGIPAIIFSLLMLFNWISIDVATQFQITFAWIGLAAILVYYFLLNARLALCTAVILIPFTFIAAWIARPTPTITSASIFLILFVGGWVLQFTGHFFEKQKPAFLISLSQILIGPLFILTEGLTAAGMIKYFLTSTTTDEP